MPAKRSATKKSTGALVKKASRKPAARPAPATKRTAATPQLKAKRAIEPGVEPAAVPGPDPKAEHARKHMNKMGGIDSQRVEEHHRMTRHKKNQ